jgi:hypothetical protein
VDGELMSSRKRLKSGGWTMYNHVLSSFEEKVGKWMKVGNLEK